VQYTALADQDTAVLVLAIGVWLRQRPQSRGWALEPMTDEALHAAAEDLVAHLTWLGPDVSVVHRLIAAGPTVDDWS
jgi:hypothetical protein